MTYTTIKFVRQNKLISFKLFQQIFFVFILNSQHFNQFVPFGTGKRICAGESLANSELFMFFVMLVQRLEFTSPKDNPLPSIDDYKSEFTNIPNPFYVSIQSR